MRLLWRPGTRGGRSCALLSGPLPAVTALGFLYLVVVYAGIAAPHEAVLVELPVLVAVAAPPLPVLVVRLVLEAHRDAVAREAPQLLHEPVVKLPVPLAAQEVPYRLTSLEELVAVPPLGVLGVGESNLLRGAGVPSVLGHLDLLPRGLLRERRQRWPSLLSLVARLHVRSLPLVSVFSGLCPGNNRRTTRTARQPPVAGARLAPGLLRALGFAVY